MLNNLQTYRLPSPWAMTADALASALSTHSFTPAGSYELLRQGWDLPRPDGNLVHVVNGQFLLKLTSEKKLLPAKVINAKAKERAAELEKTQGFELGKKAFKEIKERVADELLASAFPVRDSMWVWIDPRNGWLVVDAASAGKSDEVIKLLLKSVDRLPLESLRVRRLPTAVMTEWLQADDAPAGFTVDMDATLRATGESKAEIQWKRHTLDAAELGRHIAAGKQCVRLAMTWDSKISFVLDQTLAVKSVKLLDVLTEQTRGTSRNDDERFDSNFALFAGETAKLLADLVEALGGAADGDAQVTGPAVGDDPVREQRVATKLGDAPPEGDGSASDPLYQTAVDLVRAQDRASISLVQRLLRISYNRAAGLLMAMEGDGVVSSTQGIYIVAATQPA